MAYQFPQQAGQSPYYQRAFAAQHSGFAPHSLPTPSAFSMAELHPVQYRNAELETEMRILKYQLAQAHDANRYLITQLGSSSITTEHDSACQTSINELRAENSRLKARIHLSHHIKAGTKTGVQLHTPPGSRSGNAQILAKSIKGRQEREIGTSSTTPPMSTTLQSFDLLDLGNGADTPVSGSFDSVVTSGSTIPDIVSTSQSPYTTTTGHHDHPEETQLSGREEPAGLGISGVDYTSSSKIWIAGPRSLTKGETVSHGQPVQFSDGSFSIETPQQEETETPSFGPSFSPHDYRSLMGAAIFVEQLDPEEFDDWWQKWSQEPPRRSHTADEWRSYYVDEVRPAFLIKQHEKAAVHPEYSTKSTEAKRLTTGNEPLESVTSPALFQASVEERPAHEEVEPFDGNEKLDGAAASKFQAAATPVPPVHFRPKAVVLDYGGPEKVRVSLPSSLNTDNEFKAFSIKPEGLAASRWAHGFPGTAGMETRESTPLDAAETVERHVDRLVRAPPYVPEFGSVGTFSTQTTSTSQQEQTSAPIATQSGVPLPPYRFTWEEGMWIPLAYSPRLEDRDVYRTVLVTYIPSNVSLGQVVEKVRGGMIVKASALNTVGLKTKPTIKTLSAMIVFFSSESAQSYVEHCKHNGLCFPSTSNPDISIMLKAEVVKTPTWPLDNKTIRDITTRNLTRCIDIHSLSPDTTVSVVLAALRREDDSISYPLKAEIDATGVMHLEFASIKDACKVANILVHTPYRIDSRLQWGFVPDPAAMPLSTLESLASNHIKNETEAADVSIPTDSGSVQRADSDAGGETSSTSSYYTELFPSPTSKPEAWTAEDVRNCQEAIEKGKEASKPYEEGMHREGGVIGRSILVAKNEGRMVSSPSNPDEIAIDVEMEDGEIQGSGFDPDTE